ncbi:hypothetical protein GJ496_005308 [Pomphorhynchus laevis]|nr:hypothetical protein GJ496_005308 [Pomphorhynchus laevis]
MRAIVLSLTTGNKVVFADQSCDVQNDAPTTYRALGTLLDSRDLHKQLVRFFSGWEVVSCGGETVVSSIGSSGRLLQQLVGLKFKRQFDRLLQWQIGRSLQRLVDRLLQRQFGRLLQRQLGRLSQRQLGRSLQRL